VKIGWPCATGAQMGNFKNLFRQRLCAFGHALNIRGRFAVDFNIPFTISYRSNMIKCFNKIGYSVNNTIPDADFICA